MPRTKEQKADFLARYEAASELPLSILALALIPLLVVPLIMDVSDGVDSGIFAIDTFIWGVFVLDFAFRLYLAPAKGRFLRSNWLDALFVAVPFLRPLRAARSLRLLRLVRLGRLGVILGMNFRRLQRLFAHRHFGVTVIFFALIALVCAGVVYELERGQDGASIKSFGDAVWWAIVTMTTVGYGDKIPTTGAGRALGAVLMIVGISLFGVIAANLASVFMQQDHVEAHDERARIESKLDTLAERMTRLEHAISQRQIGDDGRSTSHVGGDGEAARAMEPAS